LTISGGATTTFDHKFMDDVILGTNNKSLFFTNSSGNTDSSIRQDTSDNLGIEGGASIQFFNNNRGNQVMTINPANVGIGSTTPRARLSVHGNPNDNSIATTLFAVASSTATATTTHFKVDNTGGVFVNGLATPAGTFVAVDPTGKFISTTTPSGSGSTVTNSYNTGTNRVQIAPISVVAGDTVMMWYVATLSSGCTSANDLVMGFGYKLGTFAAKTTAVTAGQGAGSGDRCSVAGSAMFTATTTDTIAPAVFDVASDVGADFTSVMTTVN
jgi:hypothetical protein